MPFSITCSSCSAKLKTATAIPIGRSVKCPKCSSSFAVSKENMREVDESSSAVPAPRPAPAAARTTAAPARKAAAPSGDSNPFGFTDSPPAPKKKPMPIDEAPAPKKRPMPLDDEDDAPKARKRRVDDDDEPPPPKKKRRDDDEDEDDRPRSKSKARSLDDDEDDRPRSKRRPVDDDDDDSPRARKRRDDDDDDDFDDDDRPRKPKKKKKKSNLGLKIGVIAAGVLALAGIGYLIYYLIAGGGGSFDEEMIAYLPADSKFVAGVEVAEIAGNSKLKDFVAKATKKDGDDLFKMANDKLKPAGVTVDDISRIVVGGTDSENMTMVVKSKKSFEKAKAAEAMDCKKQEKKGEQDYWSDGAEGVVYFPSDTLLVRTTKKQFEKLVSKEKGKVEISADLQEMGKKMSKGHFWVALSKDMLPPNTAEGASGGAPPEISEAIKSMKGVGFYLKADGETISLGAGMLCGSSDIADKAASAGRKKIDEEKGKFAGDAPGDAKGFANSLSNSLSVSSSGAAVMVSAEFKLSDLEPMVNMFGGAFGGGIPGFGGFGGAPKNKVPQPPPNFPQNPPPSQPPVRKTKK